MLVFFTSLSLTEFQIRCSILFLLFSVIDGFAWLPECIPVVHLEKCELELSYIPAKLFVFQIVGRFHRWCLYFKMLGKGLQLKVTTLLVFFLWLIKSLKNL